MHYVFSFFAGGLFGVGLLISGMTDTNKIQNWLDIFGRWDPTLAFVLTGAIIPMFFAWQISKRMKKPCIAESFPPNPSVKITPSLVSGSILFGVGWALVGLCPGPVIASISFGGWQGILFIISMFSGIFLAKIVKRQVN